MASVTRDEELRWVPTHVQVLVIRARGIRAKGKHGTSDAYAVVQLGKEKYSTCVMEKTTEPEWGEECSFELQPGALEDGGRDVHPAGTCDLTLTVMHRALIGLDVFLGQTVIALDKAFRERVCMRNEWYKLNSKTGKKEKERGELQLTVQFTRHNLTASMYDLSMKDKPRSAFIRLRERMRARKRGGDEESSSAIVPGGYGAIARVRGRLPSDGGGEEDYEDDEGGELRRSKMRSYFLHGRLRKSSDTRSSTSLGSESSESSSRGGSLSPTAGISVVVSDLSNSPSNSSNLTADNSPEHTVAPSPLVSPVRHVFDEVCDFSISISVPHSLTSDSDTPILLPSVCVNGNPVETSPLTHQPPSLVLQQPRLQTETLQEPLKTPQTSPPEKGKPTQAQTAQPLQIKPQPSQGFQTKQPKVESKSKPELQFPAVGLLQKGSAHSLSLQNLSRHKEEQQGGGPVDGRRWSFDKPGEEEKAAIAAALEHTGLMADEKEVEAPVSVSDVEVQGKKKRSLFSHARAEKEGTGQGQPAAEGRHRSWFSSKDPYSKPSSANYQPEVPASRPRNATSPLDLAEVGNTKGTLEDGLSDNFTCSFGSTDTPDDSDQYTQWDTIGDRLKLTSNNNTQKTIPTSTCLIEPTDQTPIYSEGDLVVSNKTFAPVSLCNITPAFAIIVGALPHFEAEVDFTCCGTPADLNNFVPLNASDSSLPHNSGIDFSELNALACPYPALSNCTFIKHKDNAVSICQENITPNAMSVLSVTPEPSALNSESLPYLGLGEMSEQETLKCISSKRKTDDTELCVDNQKTLLPYPNFDTLEASSNVTSEFLSRSFNDSESKSKLKGHKTFKSDDAIKKGDGAVELRDSDIKERIYLDVHDAAYSLGLPNPLGCSDFVLHGRLTMEMDTAGNPGFASLDKSEVSFVVEGFDVENSKFLMDSSSTDSSNMSFTKEKVTDLPPNASKRNLSLPETLIGVYEEETPNGSREMLSSALSHGDSLYESVDSEHYLTCMSQLSTLTSSQFSPVANLKSETFQEAQPKTGLSQDVLPTNYQSPWTISEVEEDPAKNSQDALPKNGDIFQSDPLNPPVSQTFLLKTFSLQNTFEKDDIINKVMPNAVTIQYVSIQKYDSPMDTMTDDFSEMMTTRPGEEPLLLDPQTFMYNDMSSTESHQSHYVQCDGPLEEMEMITNFCQSPKNVCISDFLSGSTSSITQDLVMTDLLLENMFVAQHVATHSVGTSLVAHPVPREICTKMELCPDSIEASQTSTNTLATTSTATVPQGEYLHSAIHWSTIQPPPPEPSTLDWPTSGHDLLTNSSLSLLDLSPLASSTPHVAVGINSLPLSSFPMPSAPAQSLAHTTEAASSLPPVFAASHEFFPQKERQVACHLRSPHPVKPLTPPDEKRSEGRSVLEKLKSTINPGRSHQGDQESEKKLLVEGGGSYYHLNHSQLVSLLLQRDAELQQEREEYERRGVLLEKREVELKKMKFLIRDLEDYIDTLLVRIMEQTPALLQVRPKMK